MAYTTQDYIDALKQDKENIRLNLNTKLGMDIPEGANFTDIADRTGTYVPSANLQDKKVEITENGVETIEADEGYDGLESVEITTNVSGGGDEPSIKFTGHYDREGLKAIGYDDETINWYQKNGVVWNEEDDNSFKLLESDKRYFGLTESDFFQGSTSITKKQHVINYMPFFEVKLTNYSYGLSNYNMMTIPLLDTSKITNMGYMFQNCHCLTTIPLLNTSNATYMPYTFNNCYSLISVPLLDTSKVTNMSNMFQNCRSLKTIPLLDTSNSSSTSYMFSGCYALKKVPLLDTSKVTNTYNMFSNCFSLEEVELTNSTSAGTNMGYMFSNCYALKKVELNTSNANSTSYMFQNCSSLKTIPLLDTTNVTNMSYMFSGCSALKTIPLLDTSKVTNMSNIFNGCNTLENLPLLDTSKVTNIMTAFQNCVLLRKFPAMNLKKASNYNYLFANCYSMALLDLSNIGKASSVSLMFSNCGTECLQSDGAYANGIPYVLVENEDMQDWILTSLNSHPSTWSTANVVIKGSADDPTLGA